MFDRIAHRYDLLNRLLSVGLDRRWRRLQVASLQIQPGHLVLDLGTGTGDVALEVLRQEPGARVVGLDPSTGMIEKARVKAETFSGKDRLLWSVGDAQQLPFPDRCCDAITMAFGIRNVPDRLQALREMARVLRPQGRAAILELLEPQRGFLAPLARWYIRHLVPRIGAVLSGEAEYRYLHHSMAAFPAPHSFALTMEQAGLEVEKIKPISCGVVCLFLARSRG